MKRDTPCEVNHRFYSGACSLTYLSLLFWIIVVLSFSGCATYHIPDSDDVLFKEHAETKEDGEIRITASVLTHDESKGTFGINLKSKWIQAVWVEITNNDERPYWLLFPAIDPDYYSPDEVAYVFGTFLTKRATRDLEEHLGKTGFRNPILPGETQSGFVFVNLEMGDKEVNIQLISINHHKEFVFFFKVPGIKAKTFLSARSLYSEHEFKEVDEDELHFALQYLPCCTTDKNGKTNGDPLNLVFLGNLEDLVPAFVRRDWHLAEETHWGSIKKTIGSFLFGKRYRYSPISPLYVFGRSQDVALQKARGTIHQRNHLRLWLTPLRHKGKDVWIGQISRDIGVRFTTKTSTLVTHKIDSDVDESRNAIVQDLLFSEGLKKVGFVRGVGESTRERPEHNLTGDPYFTDGMRAVLRMDRQKTLIKNVQFFNWDNPSEREMTPVSKKLDSFE